MRHPVKTIVVGVGTLTEPDPILETAVRLAEALGATLYATHAFELPPVLGYSYRIRYSHPDAYQRHREGLQTRLAAQVRKLSASEQLRYRSFEGPPAQVLNAVARRVEADLVLVGATRRGWMRGAILGTTAQRVIRTASAPTLILLRPLRLPLRRILLTSDLSALSAPVHERASGLLSVLSENPEVRVLRVVELDLPFLPPHRRERTLAEARAELDRFLSQRKSDLAGMYGRLRIGDPAQEIIAEAAEWGSDLVIVGTRSRSAAARFLLGSVAESTARGAPCNVLVVPPLRTSGAWRGTAGEALRPSSDHEEGHPG